MAKETPYIITTFSIGHPQPINITPITTFSIVHPQPISFTPITTFSIGQRQFSISLTSPTGQKAVMTLDEFNREYFELVKDRISPLLQTVISNLIRSRDYLGLQLNLEFGNIDDKEYEQLELDFLVEQIEIDPEKLKYNVEMLVKLSNRVYNSEEIATMFNCSIDVAEKSLNILLLEKESDVYNSEER